MAEFWPPSFHDVHREIDELFDQLIFRRWDIAKSSSWEPSVDIHESEEAYVVDVDLPGVPPDEVRIQVRDRYLKIEGTRQILPPENTFRGRCERSTGKFQRIIELAQLVDVEGASAECKLGTYRILLPKKYPKKVEPQAPQETQGVFTILHVRVL
ncbi:MAG: Hsp20/alpha crystallin family protein [Gemmataceae bacterium]